MGVKASRWRDKRRARDKRDEIELLMLIERGKTILRDGGRKGKSGGRGRGSDGTMRTERPVIDIRNMKLAGHHG